MRKPWIHALQIALAMSMAAGICAAQSVLTHHMREATQDGTAPRTGNLPASQNLHLVITLPLRNEDQLDQLLSDLYDPSSPSYKQFLTVEQFTEQFGPTQAEYDAMINFAQENGLTVEGTAPNRLNLQVSGTVANVEAAFHVNLGVYQHPTESRTFFAPDREPTTNLTFPLWHISGLDTYSIPHPAGLDKRQDDAASSSNATTGSGPSASFLGSDMRAAYYGGTSLTGAGQSVGLLEYVGTDLADLTTYFTNAKQTNSVPITLLSTDGTSTSCLDTTAGGDCDDTEQTLDMTQALGMAPGLSSLVMYVGSTDAAIFNAMATASPLNAQLSSSWTWTPADSSTDNPYFKEFAAQGQNLFQAAGDSSKWTTTGKASEIYPSDDVYVTSVGGTDLTTNSAAGPWASETAWADSGGGISPDKFAIPSWQTAAAAGCVSCSQTYRNGPDVSANANFTFYVCADQTTCTANEYGGTSFAAPMWAGYLALVNQQSVANGNGLLGFINPTLYSIGAGSSYATDFHDITSGSNGYSATTGYDLATGWGSPNGSGLINALAGTSSSAAAMISPAAGSTLGSGTVTFYWAAATGNVTGYSLWVGTSPGTSNLGGFTISSGLSQIVTLPTAGATVYVRLFTQINGTTTLYNDYTYTEASGSGATMISPMPGSTLGSSTVTFYWAAAAGNVTNYSLWVGTSPGSSNLGGFTISSGLSQTVTLPTAGATVYVRLFTLINGTTTLYNDYSYTEASGSAAAMISPTAGSTLGSGTVTFYWGAATGNVTSYSLWIGTSPGTSNLGGFTISSGLSQTVNLPTSGATVYVRLFTLINGSTTLYNDYNYTEASGSAAAMISPTAGSTLGSSTVTFYWAAATGNVTGYSLWVGTSPGTSNLGGFTISSGLSQIVTLPTTGATVYVRLFTQINGTTTLYNDYTYTEATGSAAAIISPASGSTLGSGTVAFYWAAASGNVTSYSLWIGTSPGTSNLGGFTISSGLSQTVTLPTTGATVYVRLFTQINGATTLYNDYTYTEATGSGATMISPVSGSTLGSGTVTFYWTAATGNVTSYSLWVGTSPGTSNLGGFTIPSGLSQIVNLPTNGATVYVRLFTVINGTTTLYNDYIYTEASGSAATMITPTPGSTLTSATTTFTWAAATGNVTSYFLWVGTSPATSNLGGFTIPSGLSQIVNLPTNGATIYVRLWTQINGATMLYNDYTYTEAP
jgi:kumamolisin